MKRSAEIIRVPRKNLSYFVGPEVDPAVNVPDGAEVVFETADCFSGKVRGSGDTFGSFEASLQLMPGWNPITGPVFVEGAHPGDFLAIDILDIKVPERGVTSYVPRLGMLSSPYQLSEDLGPETRICKIEGGQAYLPTSRGDIAIPLSPMIGTISVSPKEERIASFKFGAEHLGNVDCREITAGNRLILPVNTEGALFGLGDVHAVQGDGEISCVAIEVSAEVAVWIHVLSKEEASYVGCPQINGSDFIGSIGCHFGEPVSENIKHAYFDLIQRLKTYHGFSIMDAYHLLTQVGEVRVCQVLGDFQAAVAKVKRRYIES